MSKQIAPVRGVNDVLPDVIPYWQFLERTAARLFASYGYHEIRTPILERTDLFKRSIGEVTDIVEKEMYTFEDRGGDSLTLRPEGTAGCVRAGLSHGLLHNQKQRLWYTGPMFRRERPQRGRYRQFSQIGVEAFGYAGPDVDAELILLTARLWRELGLVGLRLELNTLGSSAARVRYREALVGYFEPRADELDEESRRRLTRNPLRILDSKNPALADLIERAPRIDEHLDPESREHFAELGARLSAAGVEFEVNSRLVRGLDYYNRTVFEWLTDRLGAQAAVCAGGRYDGLVEHLGGKSSPGVGFAMGIERLVELMREADVRIPGAAPQAYLVAVGEAASMAAMRLAESLRDACPELRLQLHSGGGGFKAQMKAADRSGAAVAILLGDSEIAAGTAGLKPLRGKGEQSEHAWQALPGALATWLLD